MKIGIIAFLFLLVAAAQPQWVQDKFIIGSYWDPAMTGNATTDESRLQVLRDCGFNTLTGTNQSNLSTDVRYKLERVANVPPLKLMVQDGRYYGLDTNYLGTGNGKGTMQPFSTALGNQILNDWGPNSVAIPSSSTLAPFSQAMRNAIFGYSLLDEFRAAEEANILDWQNFFSSGDPQKITYANLNPFVLNIPGTAQIGYFNTWADYKNYVTTYFNHASTRIGAFDYYPFLNGGGWQSYGAATTYYFRNLGLFATQSLANGKSFWAHPYSTKEPGYASFSQENMRFMVWAPVVYSAKGIIYFTYATPPGYGDAMVNSLYATTPIYTFVSSLNSQLNGLSSLLMSLRWQGVVHGGSQAMASCDGEPAKLFTTDFNSGEPCLETISSIGTGQNVLANQVLNQNCAIGIFQRGSSKYLMIFNKNRTIAANMNQTILANGKWTLRKYDKNGSMWSPLASSYDAQNETTSFSVSNIQPGDMEIVWLDNGSSMVPIRSLLL